MTLHTIGQVARQSGAGVGTVRSLRVDSATSCGEVKKCAEEKIADIERTTHRFTDAAPIPSKERQPACLPWSGWWLLSMNG